MPQQPDDNWFRKLHRWRLRHRSQVQFAILLLCALILVLGYYQNR